MKKLFLLILIVFFLPHVYADPPEYQALLLNISLQGKITASIDTKLIVNLSMLPKNDERQEILQFNTFPEAEQNNNILYTWQSTRVADFGWNATIRTNAIMPEIKEISFPAKIEGYDEYKKASFYVNINEDITKKANEIAAGKTDLFEALHALADFVYTNMTYDEAYWPTVQNASWILANKRGVCDEYTILFMALARALGIPTRFVSGVAYSNKAGFSNHAWSEVYMPGYGWIPFDATFGQFGWIDSTHIALSKTIDSGSSVIYTYKTGTKIETKELDIKTSVIQEGSRLGEKVELSIIPLKDKVSGDSFVPLKVEIINKNPYFIPVELFFSKYPGIYGSNTERVIVKPNSEATEFFILSIPAAEKKYIYTSGMEVRDQFSDAASAQIDFSSLYEQMTLEKAQSLIEQLTTSQNEYIYDTILDCSSDKKDYYSDEKINLSCKIKSSANSFLENLHLCAAEQCTTFDLAIGSETEKDFIFENKSEFIIKLENNKIQKTDFLSVNVLKKPNLKITGIKPETLDYGNNLLEIELQTESICKNLSVKINNIYLYENEIDGAEKLVSNFSGKNALSEKLNARAECIDLRNRKYEDKKIFEIKLENIPWYAKIWQFFARII